MKVTKRIKVNRRLSLIKETLGQVKGGAWHRTTHRCHESFNVSDCTDCGTFYSDCCPTGGACPTANACYTDEGYSTCWADC